MADKHEKEIDGLLRKIPFFAGLSETERAEVGASLIALRRSGGISSLDAMDHFFWVDR